MIPRFLVFTIFLSLLLFACGHLFSDTTIEKGMNSGQIRIGASKNEVAAVTGYPITLCIKARLKEDGSYEMWDFATKNCAINLMNGYALIFRDDQLIEIRTVRTMLDMQF